MEAQGRVSSRGLCPVSLACLWADLSKLSSSGFDINTLTTAHAGIKKYIEFLKTNRYY
jgi:hypothetical protein